MKLDIFGNTIIGKVRDHNEDSFVFCPDLEKPEFIFNPSNSFSFNINGLGSLMCVSDGMGGTNAGEVASYEAIQFIKAHFSDKANFEGKEIKEVLVSAIKKANDHLIDYIKSHPESEGMGTTMVLSIIKDDVLNVAWTGDSRCYVCNDNNYPLYPFTDDHSMVWELVQANQMSAEQARVHPNSNIITQSLGDSVNKPNPSFKSAQLKNSDVVIMCSDGLNGMISDSVIEEIVKEEGDSKDICNKLINEANKAGGEDNITVIITKVLETDNLFIPIAEGSINTKQISSDESKRKSSRFVIPLITALIGLFVGYVLFSDDNETDVSIETNDGLEVLDIIQNDVDTVKTVTETNVVIDTILTNNDSDNTNKKEIEKSNHNKKDKPESKPKVEETKPSNEDKKVEVKTRKSKEKQAGSSLNTDEVVKPIDDEKDKSSITKIDKSKSKNKEANSSSNTGEVVTSIDNDKDKSNITNIEKPKSVISPIKKDTTSSSK